jgi:hypothetical protein
MAVLAAELWLPVWNQSQTWDEAAHIYAGYSYWTRGDFGMNPEHPPLVKLVASLPLLPLKLNTPSVPESYFRVAPYLGGLGLLYSGNADSLLFRARVATSLFALALALLVFAAAYEMFGRGAAILTLVLFVFEPNVLGNGALVATDVGVACCFFAAVYVFYRYVKYPSPGRLVLCGVVVGLTLAAKHSGNAILPVLVLLAFVEMLLRRQALQATPEAAEKQRSTVLQTGRWACTLVVITVIAIAELWAFYGFRFRARPAKLEITPPLADYVKELHRPREQQAILDLAHWRALPEAYLYGMTDVLVGTQEGRPMFLLGKLYPVGRWFYFPIAFLIKSTVGFVVLLLLLIFARPLRCPGLRREALFLAIPASMYLIVSLTSRLNDGVRHILPVYALLIVLAGGGAWSLMRTSRRWAYIVTALVVFHVASSLRAFPDYLPYSNEIWGGPSNTYKVLTDSSLGWGSGLKSIERYANERHLTACWLAYSAPVNPGYYHIPCRTLPTFASPFVGFEPSVVPAAIDGPVLMSAIEYSGWWWGPGRLNPYEPFTKIRPVAILQGEILVYDGHFAVPAVSALSHAFMAERLAGSGKPEQALAEVQATLQLNPDSVGAHITSGQVLSQLKRASEAHAEFEKALTLARADHPEFQTQTIAFLQTLLAK